VSGIALAAHYEPAGVLAEVGGDWYDAFALAGGRIGVVVGDVAGKGIPAASAMGQLRSVTRAFALADGGRRSPGEVLTSLNRFQLSHDEQELFTILYAVIDPSAGTVEWSSAGHLPPLVLEDGDSSFLGRGDGLMGLDDVEYQTLTRPISGGGMLLLFTDGLVERRGESLDIGLARLATAAASGPDQPKELCEHVLAELLPPEYQLHDDVTAVVVKVL
jgi:serine phosphatase RsbU (regulator of sigma subunit)